MYVRYNRSRLKGKNGMDDTNRALTSLYNVLLVLCKTMAPFTPFFVENMYQNLKLCLPDGGASEPSVHFCLFPEASADLVDVRVEASVQRMQSVIETGRQIRERNNKPLKTPLKKLIVAHDDGDFLSDLQGELRDYVVEELNCRELEVCDDPLKYATIKAEPNFAVLGKRLGKAMGLVGKAVKAMSVDDILAFQKSGEFKVEGCDQALGLEDILVKREFSLPDGFTAETMDAATGEGEVLVVMELEVDQSLLDSGSAREFVNRLQKMRKSSGLQASDTVAVYFEPAAGNDADATEGMLRMLQSEAAYLTESLGCAPLPISAKPADATVVASGECQLSTGAEFVATLAAMKI